MTNSGKTCTAVALAKLVQKKRSEPKYKDLQLIFCCNLPAVKDQVAQWTYNIANVADPVPFGIGCMDSRGARVINSFNCKSDAERIVIVCSPDVARRLLSADSGAAAEKYIVFHDEPTVGADVIGSSSLEQNVEMMTCPSKWTIWSSATLPPREKMSRFIDIVQSRFPSVKVEYVYSNKIQIGCDIYTYNGDVVVPHLGCKTREELATTIQKIKGNPFLGRPYTPNVVETIWLLMVNHKIRDIPNIGVLFEDVDNLTADKVREIAMTLLEILSTQPDAVIESICESPITAHRLLKAAPEAAASTDDLFDWEEEKKPECLVTNRLVFEHLGTTEAHKFLLQTLIATADPLNFAITSFNDLLGYIKSEVRSIKKLYSVYEKELSLWQAQYDRIEKDVAAAAKQRDRDAPRLGSADDEISRRQQAMVEIKPTLSFPKDLQVNTLEHIQRFARGTNVVINPQSVRAAIITTNIDTPPDKYKSDRQSESARIDVNKMNVPEEVLFLLFAGIGIYAPSCKHLNSGYLSTVLAMAKEGKLAFLVCDSTICYGTNYPVNRTVTLPDFAMLHSTNTLQQYMSRAGRVGQSWIAEAYIDDDTARRLIACCHAESSSDEDCEITNMVATLDAINEASRKRDEELMERIHEELRLEAEMVAAREAEMVAAREAEIERTKETERRLAQPVQPVPVAKVERPRVVEIGEVLKRNQETSHTAASWRRDISRDDAPRRQPVIAAETEGLVRRPGAYQPPHLREAGARPSHNSSHPRGAGAPPDQPPQQQKRAFGSGWGRK
jgi:hypothetical protein